MCTNATEILIFVHLSHSRNNFTFCEYAYVPWPFQTVGRSVLSKKSPSLGTREDRAVGVQVGFHHAGN
jgi:hypothetical protein